MVEDITNSESMVPEPHRLLFLHGLFRKSYPHSGRMVANLIAQGLDGAQVSTAPDLLLDDGGRCQRYLIQPSPATKAWRAIEVVDLVYDDIIARFDRRRPLIKSAAIGAWLLLSQFWRLWRLFLPGHPRITAAQVGVTILMAFVLVAAVLVMAAVVVPIVYGAYGYGSVVLEELGFLSIEDGVAQVGGGVWISSNTVVGSIAFLALLAAMKKLLVWKSYSEIVDDARSCMFAVLDYQKPKSKLRRALLARVHSALQVCADGRGENPVSVLAFSQGSLLAIDALFPIHSTGESEASQPPKVDLLVTFGCPLAILHRLWPSRPVRAGQAQNQVQRWINYYETHDQLGGKIAALVKAEGIGNRVEDRKFSFTLPSGRPFESPHITYWMEGSNNQRPSATLVAPELVRIG